MKEYIERDAVIETARECRITLMLNEGKAEWVDVYKALKKMGEALLKVVKDVPAADVVEIKKYELAVAEREANAKALIEAQQHLAKAKAEIETWEHRWEYLFPSETPVFTAIGNCVLYSPSSEDYDKVIDEIGAEAIKEVANQLEAEWESSNKYIRELGYEDSITQGAYNKGLLDALNVVKEMERERE